MKFKMSLLGILLLAFFQAQSPFKFLETKPKQNSPSLFIFYKPDCPYCIKLDEEITSNHQFSSYVKENYNVSIIDITTPEGKNIANLYNVHNVPLIIELDENIKPQQLIGFHKSEFIKNWLLNKDVQTKQLSASICGNGIVEIGEQCDDGNSVNGDGCTNSCTIQSGFICYGTPSICTPSAVCGNGIVEPGEVCDDGNLINNDRCDNTCTRIAACGNGYIEIGEQCDDGNSVNGDGCDNTCTLTAVCGNGIIEQGENCDDGNSVNGDGCTNSCTIQSGYTCSGVPSVCTPNAVCGNGIVEPGEVCDDGNLVNGDSCNNTCTVKAACGNGYVEIGEQCDDGNSVNGDGCDNTCTLTAVCGNGIVEPGETCDDGNLVNGDGCNNTCTPSVLSVGEVENTGVLNLKIGYDSAFSNNIKVQFFLAKKTKLEIEILDLSGRKLLKRSYNQLIVGLNNIDVELNSKTISGIYLINLKFENENNVSVVSKKIIVK